MLHELATFLAEIGCAIGETKEWKKTKWFVALFLVFAIIAIVSLLTTGK